MKKIHTQKENESVDSIHEISHLIQVHQQYLSNFALKLTNNIQDAEDLFQEMTYNALKFSDKFKVGTNAKAWLGTIMKNIFINQYRKKNKRGSAIEIEQAMSLGVTDETGIQQYDYEQLESVVFSLKPNLFDPFWLHYIGYSYEEIADELEKPLRTIKSRIFFARKELKAILTQDRNHN